MPIKHDDKTAVEPKASNEPSTASRPAHEGEKGRPRLSLFDRLFNLALLVAVAVQVVLLADGVLLPLARGSWEVRGLAARERSSRLAFGDSFSGYIEFLNEIIPEDALVVLPPSEIDSTFGHSGLMQYFLFPRRLTNCPAIDAWPECSVNYQGERTYLLSINGFPPPGIGLELKTFVAFDDRWGLFVPTGSHP